MAVGGWQRRDITGVGGYGEEKEMGKEMEKDERTRIKKKKKKNKE